MRNERYRQSWPVQLIMTCTIRIGTQNLTREMKDADELIAIQTAENLALKQRFQEARRMERQHLIIPCPNEYSGMQW